MTTQISLSFELICLISWLLKHEKVMLNSMVKHAVERGFAEELAKFNSIDQGQMSDDLHMILLDYLDFLENNLIKHLESFQVDDTTKDAILPALQKIETDILDYRTVWLSMQQTKARVSKVQQAKVLKKKQEQAQPHIVPSQENPSEILFERLLKNWKPNNKETVN